MKPRVSVLLPVRDGADVIARALASLCEQTLREIEIVVVDDGSRDDTAAVVERMAAADARITLVGQPPLGIVAALDAAAARARAPLFARMDADDVSHPERLALQHELLAARPDCAVASCLVRAEAPADGWHRYVEWLNGCVTPEQIARELFVESPLSHPSVMMRRTDFEAVGGYRDFDGPEDYDLWLRLAAAGARFIKVARELLVWTDGPGRLTRVDPRYRPEAFTRLKAQHLARGPLARAEGRPLVLWGAGRYGRLLGRELERADVAIEAYVDIDPKKIGRTRRGRPVLSFDALQAQHPDAFVVGAVPIVEARVLIRQRLTSGGRCEGRDFLIAA